MIEWATGFCRRPAFIVFLASRAAIVLAFTSVRSDVPWVYFPSVRALTTGTGAPYVSVPFPYPPGALLAVLAPALIRSDPRGYHLAFQAEMVLVDVLTFILLARFLEVNLRLERSKVLRGLIVYGSLSAVLGVLVYDRLDLWVALIFTAALGLYREESDQRPTYKVAMTIGTLIKLVPAFWVPLSIGRKSVRSWLAFFVVPVLAVMAATDFASHGGLMRSLAGLGQRGIQIDSVWATPFVFARAFGLTTGVTTDFLFAAVNITGPSVPSLLVAASKWAGFATLAAFYGWWWSRSRSSVTSAREHFLAAFFVLILLMSTQRVLSPQYFIWLIPGVAAASAAVPLGLMASLGFAALYGLTCYLFPHGFEGVGTFQPTEALVLTARNALLVAMTVYVWVQLRHAVRTSHVQ